MKIRLSSIIYLRWFDSSITSGETCLPEDVSGILENESAGLLIREDKKSITIALDHCLETNGVRCSLCVPKTNVRSIRRIRMTTGRKAASKASKLLSKPSSPAKVKTVAASDLSRHNRPGQA
jgi:hypothetical protein